VRVGIILGVVVVVGDVGRDATVAVLGVARQKKQDFSNAAVATLITRALSLEMGIPILAK
jgi:hypothetical protein